MDGMTKRILGLRTRGSKGWGLSAACLAGLTVAAGTVSAQAVPLPVDDGRWEISGDAAPGLLDGKAVMNMRQGDVDRPGLSLSDGTLEFDMKVSDRRTFVGVKLRMKDDGTCEDIYFRPHKSGLPDAIQYDPAYAGVGTWQLYHGPDATAFAWYRPGEWEHVRIEVRGTQAAIFLGDGAEPSLVVHHLRTGAGTGGLGFWALQPGATADDPWTVSLANVTVRPGVTSWTFPPPAAEALEPGAIRRWQVAAARSGEAADLDALPSDLGGWTVAEAEPSGLLPLDRVVARPRPGPALTFARVRIRADEARTVRMDLGYSDNATVFLDGRPVFTGRFSYSYNFPRRDGLITPDQATVHLSLSPGTHDVVVAVSDVFGGWGLMGRIMDRRGVQVLEP